MKKYAPLLSLPFLLFVFGCPREKTEPPGPLFDVPALMGQTPAQIEAQLGAPVKSEANSKTWQKEGTKLTMQLSQSGLLAGFVLQSEEPLKDEKRARFLKRGNLKEDDNRYQLSFIEAPDKVFHFTGAQIQLPPTREVELRLEGPPVMTSMTINGEEFMTIPPWNNSEKKLQATLGQTVSIAAEVLTKPGQMPPKEPLKVQILVEGRVLKEHSAPYEARCEIVL